MPSRAHKRYKAKVQKTSEVLDRRKRDNPFLYGGSIAVLVLVIIAFIVAPGFYRAGGGRGKITFGSYQGRSIDYVPGNYFARQREILVGRMQEIFAKIEFLLGLGERAERKPPLAGHRPYDWFRTGDPVVCYIGGLKRARISQRGWGENNLTFKEWFFGKVGECSCEGGLVFVNPSLGYGGWYSASRPEILHVWEYSYLCGHLGFAKVWMANVPPHLEDFDPDRMLAALNK